MSGVLCFILFCFCSVAQGFVDVGTYSKLASTQSLTQSGYINGWRSTGKPGLYTHDAELASSFNEARVPVSGIYFTSTTLILSAEVDIHIKGDILVNKNSKRKTGLTSFTSENRSITIKCLVQLGIQDSLSVYVDFDNKTTLTVSSQSTFYIQLLYSLTYYPAFQTVLSQDSPEMKPSIWHSTEKWTAILERQSGLSTSTGTYCASCDGIFSIQGNIVVESSQYLNGSVGIFHKNQTIISEEYFSGPKNKTVEVGGVYRLAKGECIDVRTRSFSGSYKVIMDSGLSLFYLGAQPHHAGSSRLIAHASTIASAGLHDLNGWTADNSEVFFKSSQVQMMTGNLKYEIRAQGSYLISASVTFKSSSEKENENVQLLVIINKQPSSSPSDATIVAKQPISIMTSLTINGVLFLSENDNVTLCVYKDGSTPLTPLAGSHFSVAMIPKDWPGFAATLTNDQAISSLGWNEIGGWEAGNSANGLFSFDNAMNVTSGRYVVPLDGTYIISCSINIVGGARKPLEVMIAVDGKTATTSSLYSRQQSGRGQTSIPITGTLMLSHGQYLSLLVYVATGSTWTVARYSSFSVSLNGAGTTYSQVFQAVKTQKDDFITSGWKEVTRWQPRDSTDQSVLKWDATMTRFTAAEDGIYLITARLLVSVSAASGVHASGVHSMIVVDGNSNKYSGGQSFQRVFQPPSSPWLFTVPVSCSLKLTTSQYVSIYMNGDVAYSIQGNSTLSIVLISTLSNPHRGGLNTIALADSIIGDRFNNFKYWRLSISEAYGVYKEKLNFQTEYTQIENSGIYFLEVTAKFEAVGSFGPYTLAFCSPSGAPLSFRTIKQSDGSDQDRDKFGIALFALLYLTRGQKIYLCLSGQKNNLFLIDAYRSGYSIIKIVPPRFQNPGLRQMANTLASREWSIVSDWTSGGTGSLYKRGKVSSPGSDDFTVSKGTYFLSSSLSSLNNSTSEVCMTSSTCSVCYMHATFTGSGVNQAIIRRAVQSQTNYKMCTKQYSGIIARSAQFLPHANVNTSFYYRHDRLTLNGEKTMTAWTSEDNETHSNIVANLQGFYMVTLNIVLKSTSNTRMNASVFLNPNGVTSTLVPGLYVPATWFKANEPMALGLASLVRMEKGHSLNVKVFSDTSTASVQSGASFSTGLVTKGTTYQGMSVRQPRNLALTATSIWTTVQGWEPVLTGAVSSSSFAYQGRYLVEASGVYIVMATVSVSMDVPTGKQRSIGLLLSIDGDTTNTNLIMSRNVVGEDGMASRTVTLSLSSAVYLSKWQAVFPMLRSSVEQKVVIQKESSFYIVLVDRQRQYTHGCSNKGPRIFLHPRPFQRVSAGTCSVISLACIANADGEIKYRWLKNNQLIKETRPNMVITNARMSDAGRYNCIAEANNVTVTSSPAVVEVFETRAVFSRNQFEVTLNETTTSVNLLVIDFTALTVTEEKANVSFIIETGNISDTFKFSPSQSTSEVTLTNTKSLDYETIKTYQLTVKTTNTNTQQLHYINVIININDVNDNYPKFTPQAYSATVSEDAWIGALVLQVTAVDADSGDNSKIVFDIVSGNTGSVFGIHHDNGIVFVNNSLDFETNQSYNLTIEARDKGNPSLKSRDNAHVIIAVHDGNDNTPVFFHSKYNFAIAEHSGNGTLIGRINASDVDKNNNGRISYSILDNDMLKVFTINKTSGELSLVGNLDYEVFKLYVLLIIAQDHGRQPRSSATLVYVHVQDVNDYYPTCTPVIYHVTVTEATLVGAEITRVYADDKDQGLNGEIRYSITGGNTNGNFRVSSRGVIILNKTLDREVKTSYNLSITLTDKGVTPKVSHNACRVVITVLDVNNNYPQFLKDVYYANISEHASVGYDVIGVQATDADSGSNGYITYEIDKNCSSVLANRKLTINATTGVVYTTDSIDFDNLADKSFRFRVVAKDGGRPSLLSYVSVVVTVTDANDNAPVFSNLPNVMSIWETTPENHVIFTVVCKDNDAGYNALITFYILSVKENGIPVVNQNVFAINSTSGQLFPIKAFQENFLTRYDVTILAKDTGIPSLNSTSTLTVIVKDINDRTPIFEETVYEKTFTTPPPKGSILETVQAKDADLGNNSVIDYKIAQVNATNECPREPFTIANNGSIYTIQELTSGCQYSLRVTAHDRGIPPRVGECRVVIIVKRSNKTTQDKSTESADSHAEFILALVLGIVAVIMLVLVLVLCVKCRRGNFRLNERTSNDDQELHGL